MRKSSPVDSGPPGELRALALLGIYLRPYRGRLVLAVLMIIFTSAAVLGMGGALRYLVDEGLGHGDVHLLNRAYGWLLAVTALLAAASYGRYYVVSWLSERAVADIRADVFGRLIRLDIAFFEITRTGELLSRLTADTTLLQTVIGTTVSFLIRNMLTATGGFTLLILTSPSLTAYVAASLVFVVAPILLLGRRVRVMARETQAKVGALNAEAEEYIYAIRAVKALTLEEEAATRFGVAVNAALSAALSRIRLRAFLTATVIALAFGGVVTVLWVGGHDVLAGRMTPGALSSFVFYAVVVAVAVGAISDGVSELQRAAGASERLGELLRTLPGIQSPSLPAPLPSGDGSVSVEFQHVSFHYPARPAQAAVKDIQLTLNPGEVTALVGPSGAGKTTLLQLLLRFYDPEAGTILLGGTDIRTLDMHAYRRLIGLVPQEPVIFSADAYTNIRYGCPEASDETVREAARQASALEFLQALPQGLQTHLGEKGVRLSGGQKQRIAIARALIRNPRILLLDEATSALDSENEHAVQEALARLMQGRTTLVVAHRLSTIMNAERIVLMDEGRIQAIGRHSELLEKSPLYARLARLQFHQESA